MSNPLWDTCRNIVINTPMSSVPGIYNVGVIVLYVRCPHCLSNYGPYSSLSAAQTNRARHLRECDCRKSVNEETDKLFASLRED